MKGWAVTSRFCRGGFHLLVPFVDRVAARVDLREQVANFPPQPVITADQAMVSIDSVIYFQITDPRGATYEVANFLQAIEQLTATTLRNLIGSLDLEQTQTSRESINKQLRGVLDEATGPWGIRVTRVELKSIEPPPRVLAAMEQQITAERTKRATILTAEAEREAQIKKAEGAKQAAVLAASAQQEAQVLQAKGQKEALILQAEGARQAQILRAQGEAEAIQTVFAAINAGKATPELLSYKYLEDAAEDRRRPGVQAVDAAIRSDWRTGIHLEGFQPGQVDWKPRRADRSPCGRPVVY